MKTIEDNQTIKDNVLIANFMGWDEFNTGSYHTPYDNASYCNGEETSICNRYALKFHSSWEWLMPVVEKIESLGYGVTIYRKGCHINDIGLLGVNGFNHKSKIEQTWLAVVEFIKWYNNH